MSDVPKSLRGGPISWMARNSVAANLMMFMIIVAGLVGISQVKQEVFPEFQLDIVSVSVPYPGASPAEVEQGIVLAVEEQIRGVDGVKRVVASSSEGVGTVTAELLLGVNPDKVLADIKNSIDQIQTFPEDAEDPTVQLASNRQQVISLIVSGDQDMATLYALGERMRADLLERGGVTQVEVFGVPPLEVAIEVDRETQQSLGLTLDQIAQEVSRASLEVPGGGVSTDRGEVLVRVSDRRLSGEEFGNIVLKGTASGSMVTLDQVATIVDGFEDNDQASFLNGRPAVRVTAYRIGDETPTGVADVVKAYAEDLRAQLPPNMDLAVWNDDSELLRGRIDLLVRNAQTGLILVLLILALFLNLRLAFWVGLGIPISFLGAFLLMPAAAVSINMISLFALIITLGMVVDDAIVVGENIYEKIEHGMEAKAAAIQGAREMAVPISFAILTTAAAFAPMLFVPGFSGKIFGIIPIVVTSVLLFSLIESFFILPAHLSHKPKDTGIIAKIVAIADTPREICTKALERFIKGPYSRALKWCMEARYTTATAAFSLFVLAIATAATGLIPFSFFPKIEGDLLSVQAQLPYGSPIERTKEVNQILENALEKTIEEEGYSDKVRGVFARVGEGLPDPQKGASVGSHLVGIEVNLVKAEERDFTAADFTAAWQANVPEIPGLESITFNSAVGPGAGAAVDVLLSHRDTAVLAEASQVVAKTLRGYSELYNISNSYSSGKPQLDFTMLPQAKTLGITANDVARQLRASFYGAEAIREQRDRNEIKVMVRLPKDQRTSEYDIDQMRILTPQGDSVPLGTIATYTRGEAPTTIDREDGRRVVNVTADLAPGIVSSQEVVADLNSRVLPELKEAYPNLTAELAGEQREQSESLTSLGIGYVMALFAIYALLAIPFKSYIQPFIIMSCIPLGLVGAFAGHLVMGFELSIISIMGIIALSGVVVNDSLVLIDSANIFRREGMGAKEAIFAAGRRRFRPILLTSLTTFFGLLPMIFEPSIQARFLIPMAISLGYGVLFATFIVLLVVPALYLVTEDFLGLFGSGDASKSSVRDYDLETENLGMPAALRDAEA